MLQMFVIPELERHNILTCETLFQHDEAPPHYAMCVRDLLVEVLPIRWIGHADPISWPPQSPDLTPLNCFLWGFINDRVYATIPELIDKIVTTVQMVTPCMLSKVHDEMESRLHLCISQGGRHIENYGH